MRIMALILLLVSPVFASQKYGFDDPHLDDEFVNNYKEHIFPNISIGKASTMTITQLNASTVTAVQVNTSNINGTFIGLGRNRILNGDMRIDQVREGTAYSTIAGGSLAAGGGLAFYALDQWRFEGTRSSTFTILRTNEALPPTTLDSLFSYSMRISIISSTTINSGDGNNMEYPMEPIYQQDWGWGTSAAVPITLQFWVASSSAGTRSLSFLNGVNSRSYVTTYAIATANTWQKVVVTIPGDTVGSPSVWPTSGPVFGLKVVWDMGSGSGVTTSTLNQWQAGSLWRAAGSDNFVDALATVYFTGVQLEIGTVATAFEYMPYDIELRALQRYFFKTFPPGLAVASNVGATGALIYNVQIAGTLTGGGAFLHYPASMLATPVITYYNPFAANAKWRAINGATADSGTPTNFYDSNDRIFVVNPQVVGDIAGELCGVHLTANSRLGGS